MLSCITLAKFESWKGTTEYFILNWKDQIRMHKSLVNADSYFSENQKKILLENLVASVKPLRSVKDQHDQLYAHTGKELDCDQRTVFSAATNYDTKFVSESARIARKSS